MVEVQVDKWSSPLTKWFNNDLIKSSIQEKVAHKVPVFQYSFDEPVTVQFLEDSLLSDCNHAGAYLDVVERESLHGNWHTGEMEVLEYTAESIVCDKCPAWQDEEGVWHE